MLSSVLPLPLVEGLALWGIVALVLLVFLIEDAVHRELIRQHRFRERGGRWLMDVVLVRLSGWLLIALYAWLYLLLTVAIAALGALAGRRLFRRLRPGAA